MSLQEMDFDVTDEKEAKKWLFKENIRLGQQKAELEWEREQLEREKHLFDMKWQLLEEELRRLAEDRKKMEREREEINGLKASRSINEFSYSVFFVGVSNRLMLKKRYKDLIKIFHPDNLAGHKETLQEINREYENLKQIFV